MFCPECGNLMKPVDGTRQCPAHGTPDDGSAEPESAVIRSQARDKEVAVVEEKGAGLPRSEEECPECGHYGAYYYERQTRAADEATTRFYICEDCDHRWRDYQ